MGGSKGYYNKRYKGKENPAAVASTSSSADVADLNAAATRTLASQLKKETLGGNLNFLCFFHQV